MMSSSRDAAQRASDLSALILTAGVIGVSLLVRPFQWREQGPRTPADQPVELSVEDPPDTTPTPPAPPPRLVPHEIVTRVPVPEVPDPVTLTDDPMPESAVVVAALNPSPPKASIPAAHNADLEAQYAEALREDIDRRTHLPDSPPYRLHRVFGEVRVRFLVTRSGEPREVQVARSSGSPILDQTAVAIVAAGHYAAMPTVIFVNDAQHLFAVTIAFSATVRAAQAH
jgi:TonB family protein